MKLRAGRKGQARHQMGGSEGKGANREKGGRIRYWTERRGVLVLGALPLLLLTPFLLDSSFCESVRECCICVLQTCSSLGSTLRLSSKALASPCTAVLWNLGFNFSLRRGGTMASSLQIELVPCLQDNYAYLLHDTNSRLTGIVDPSEAEPVVKALKAKGFGLDFILNTHHHWDHTGANLELKSKFNAKVVGPKVDKDRIPGIDIPLSNENWKFGNHVVRALHTPGHTRGHVCYYFEQAKAVFTGDTLFSIGCGRVFEGTMDQMWSSLSQLSSLPEDTRVFCGHEYTVANARFAVTVEPKNVALNFHKEVTEQLRQKGQPTIPTTIGEEKSFNPFLRPFSEEIRKSVKKADSASDVDVFAAVRRAKDTF